MVVEERTHKVYATPPVVVVITESGTMRAAYAALRGSVKLLP